MHEIPPEILSYIFKHVVENNCFGRLNSRYSQQIGAFFLTKICSRWRAVALDTPGIWAHVCIRQVLGSPFDMRTEELKLELERLRLCIERARSFPLSLEVLVEEERPSIDYRNSKEGLTALLKEVTRKSDSEWGSLTVRMKRVQTNVCEDVFKMMKNDGNLEPLRRLEIHFDIIQNMESSLQAFQGAATFPNLRTLCLEHRPVGYTREGVRSFRKIDNSIFPYSQLTYIHLHLITLGETLEALKLCCGHVQSVQIDSMGPFRPSAILPPISFPLLDSLVINSCYAINVWQTLDILIAPSLKSLSLSCMGMPHLDAATSSLSPLFQALDHFLERSAIRNTLQNLHLSIHGVDPSPFPAAALIDVLKTVTGVEELMMNVSRHGHSILDYSQFPVVDFLHALEQDESLLPKLKHLHIHHLVERCCMCTPASHSSRSGLQQDNGSSSGSDSDGGTSECSHHEWAYGFTRMVKLRSAGELRSVILEVETKEGNQPHKGSNLGRLKRVRKNAERGLEMRVVRTCGAIIQDDLLSGEHSRQLSLYHHRLWIRTWRSILGIDWDEDP